jgi:hypothetical protein
MKLVIGTISKKKPANTYLVRVPNYFDVNKVQELLEAVEKKIPATETVAHHTLYGDWVLSIEERNQIDYTGKVTDKPIEIEVEYDF